ncbi:hypothetical protein D3C86_1823900 [compost metagenome]
MDFRELPDQAEVRDVSLILIVDHLEDVLLEVIRQLLPWCLRNLEDRLVVAVGQVGVAAFIEGYFEPTITMFHAERFDRTHLIDDVLGNSMLGQVFAILGLEATQ